MDLEKQKLEIKGALVHFYRNASQEDYLQALENAIEEIQTIKDINYTHCCTELNYGFKKLDIIEWKGVHLKIIHIHEDTQAASIETLPNNKNYNIYRTSLRNIKKVI